MSVTEKPIIYEGVEIKTYDDLLENFRLETFEETMDKKNQVDPETGKTLDKMPPDIDDEFLKLIKE